MPNSRPDAQVTIVHGLHSGARPSYATLARLRERLKNERRRQGDDEVPVISDFRLIETEACDGGWAAWFSGRRELAVEAATRGAATRLLCESCGIECRECPDCGGSGQYVGLNVTEECRKCSGCGVAWFCGTGCSCKIRGMFLCYSGNFGPRCRFRQLGRELSPPLPRHARRQLACIRT